MGYGQYQQIIKRLPTVLAGVMVGAVLMYGMGRFPVLIEVNWGAEESHVRFDSRTERWCEAVSVATY